MAGQPAQVARDQVEIQVVALHRSLNQVWIQARAQALHSEYFLERAARGDAEQHERHERDDQRHRQDDEQPADQIVDQSASVFI
jgi:hypothetical protein